jgi:hypothetical protein
MSSLQVRGTNDTLGNQEEAANPLSAEGVECLHCGDASRQHRLIKAMEVYRCGSTTCGCIYDRSTGTKLTFGRTVAPHSKRDRRDPSPPRHP